MKSSLRFKLIFSYLAVALVIIAAIFAIIRMTSGQTLMNLVVEQQTEFIRQLVVQYYEENGSLEGFNQIFSRPPFVGPNPYLVAPIDGAPNVRVRGLDGLVDADYRAIIHTLGYAPGETVPREGIEATIPIRSGTHTIAYILPDKQLSFSLSTEETIYLRRITLALLIASALGILLAVVLGLLFARGILKPVRELTAASQALAGGDLQQQVPVSSRDELGQLADSFNQMSSQLALADRQRKRLIADISHDLGTPLQIVSGYMEILESQEHLTAAQIEIIKFELEHLRRLVADLSMLSQIEAGGMSINLTLLEPYPILERVAAAFQHAAAEQGVALVLRHGHEGAQIVADEVFLIRILRNLIENALRYTPAGGRIELFIEGSERIRIGVADSGQGIDAEDLPHVFESFYRGDKSRESKSGKMGLGLAIVQALVQAQQATITVSSGGAGKGSLFLIGFPPYTLTD